MLCVLRTGRRSKPSTEHRAPSAEMSDLQISSTCCFLSRPILHLLHQTRISSTFHRFSVFHVQTAWYFVSYTQQAITTAFPPTHLANDSKYDDRSQSTSILSEPNRRTRKLCPQTKKWPQRICHVTKNDYIAILTSAVFARCLSMKHWAWLLHSLHFVLVYSP